MLWGREIHNPFTTGWSLLSIQISFGTAFLIFKLHLNLSHLSSVIWSSTCFAPSLCSTKAGRPFPFCPFPPPNATGHQTISSDVVLMARELCFKKKTRTRDLEMSPGTHLEQVNWRWRSELKESGAEHYPC